MTSRVAANVVASNAPGRAPPVPWISDQGDGTYRNPVLFMDFPDPDVIRVGADYYLVCSTFSHVPGLTLLHSRDLVNWRYLTHVFSTHQPAAHFSRPRRGCGVWAPSLRHHAGQFWIFYPDPDFGIYMTTAANPAGPWAVPHMVKAGKGLIDPCPLWDEDGRAYLVHARARSRSGINNILTLHQMSPDGTRVFDDGVVIVDGNRVPGCHTLEGPKLYKRGGWYFVFAPAGGVAEGWQSVFRARDIRGPYETRIVLEQGGTAINGPHQGAWVETPAGESWFFHFQDRGAFGRILHLQPMRWRDDGWPVIGHDPADTGRGEPVLQHRKPDVDGSHPMAVPATSDEFDAPVLGPQWQWEANFRRKWYSLTAVPGSLRLFVQPAGSLFDAPNIVTQRLAGPASVVTTELDLSLGAVDTRAGLVVLGMDYAWIGVERTAAGPRVIHGVCKDAGENGRETKLEGPIMTDRQLTVRVTVGEGGACRFSYRLANGEFVPLGDIFPARAGKWVGARVGLFALANPGATTAGHVDVHWFRVTP